MATLNFNKPLNFTMNLSVIINITRRLLANYNVGDVEHEELNY